MARHLAGHLLGDRVNLRPRIGIDPDLDEVRLLERAPHLRDDVLAQAVFSDQKPRPQAVAPRRQRTAFSGTELGDFAARRGLFFSFIRWQAVAVA